MFDLHDLPRLLDQVIELAVQAGLLIEKELARPDGPRGGGDKAEVDVEIEEMLRPELLQLLACDFAGEETGIILTGHPFAWVVDPNDGTSDFLKGRPGSAISIGLLRDGVPVLGVVYAPVSELGPDCIAWAEGLPTLLRNGQPIGRDLSSATLSAGAVVFVSYSAHLKPEQNAALCQPASFHPMPSIAYRLARVAAGDGVAAVSLYSVSPHDVVAAHALLRAVNGDIWNEQGQALRYGSPADFSQPLRFCFGGGPAACAQLLKRPWSSLLGSTFCSEAFEGKSGGLDFSEILTLAIDVLGTEESAMVWLYAPAMGLSGARPIDLLSNAQGQTQVRDFLMRLLHGVYQ
jgi:myo-inositol-1(or 4)-monophosphatase